LLQVEADIRPFRSLLLGLFFVTTGSSVDLSLLLAQWPIVIALLGGLLSVKIGIIGTISQWFGLNKCVPYRIACSFHRLQCGRVCPANPSSACCSKLPLLMLNLWSMRSYEPSTQTHDL
jgi:hypothetical protein